MSHKNQEFIVVVHNSINNNKSIESNFINKREYIFSGLKQKVCINYTDNGMIAEDDYSGIVLLLQGEVYGDNGYKNYFSNTEYLIKMYLEKGISFASDINGSFCLIIIDKLKEQVLCITDRLNTRKIFYTHEEKCIIFASSLTFLRKENCKPSYAGIASYLINGVIYNNLTLFHGIKMLDSASITKLDTLKLVTQKYWDLIFTNEFKNVSKEDLSKKLNKLYVESVRKIITGKKNIFLSLSGGHDSRGLAAILNNIIDDDQKVICFSHNFGTDIEGTDAGIAKKIATKFGFEFKLLSSYDGNPVKVIKTNAELGQGLAYLCIETDAWDEMNKIFITHENSVLLTGDMNDGAITNFHGNIKRALERTQIFEPKELIRYKDIFSDNAFERLFKGWSYEYDEIINQCERYPNIEQLFDFLYLDQRIPHVNSIARECYQKKWIETATPYYDNQVLDFICKTPPYLRKDRELHKYTLEKNYPEVFKIEFPKKGWGNEPNWEDEIFGQKDGFIDDLISKKSMLDDLISPSVIIAEINKLNKNHNGNKKVLKNIHRCLKKVIPNYHRAIELIPGGKELIRKSARVISPRISSMLPKILILRYYLQSSLVNNDSN